MKKSRKPNFPMRGIRVCDFPEDKFREGLRIHSLNNDRMGRIEEVILDGRDGMEILILWDGDDDNDYSQIWTNNSWGDLVEVVDE